MQGSRSSPKHARNTPGCGEQRSPSRVRSRRHFSRDKPAEKRRILLPFAQDGRGIEPCGAPRG